MKKKTTRRAKELNVDEVVVRQSLAERRAAEAHLRVLIDLHALTHVRLINATRRNLRKRLPTAIELIYEYRDCIVISFSPSVHGYEGVFSIRADEAGVRLYFNRGKGLNDPEKRLRGSRKLVRFITLEGSATLSLPSVSRMIDETILGNPIPFASQGRGAVILQSVTSKTPARTRKSQPSSSRTSHAVEPCKLKPKKGKAS